MAWNKPSNNGSAKTPDSRRRQAGTTVAVRGAVAGVIVAVGVGVALWMSFRGDDDSSASAQDKISRKIAEVAPHIPTNSTIVAQTPRKQTPDEKRLAQIKFYEDKYGTNMPKQIETLVYFLKHPPERIFEADVPFKFLKNPCDRQIASLMSVPPGSYFLVQPQYGESFNRGYQATFMDKVEILPGDDEATVAVKNLVNDTKSQIAEIVRNEGKKPNEIMNEHAQYMYELGALEEQLRAEIRKARRNTDISDTDFEDLIAAANVLRKRRGLPEQKVPSLSRSLMNRRKLKK